MKFPPDSGGVPAGFGGAPGYTNVAAHGFPVQNHGPAPVIVMQPQGGPTEGWRSGLFDCMDDPNNGDFSLISSKISSTVCLVLLYSKILST